MAALAMPPGEQQSDRPAFDALILAGGQARRLGGQDKPGLDINGTTLIGRAARAVARAERVVLVGPARPELPQALVTCETPPGAGPAAAVAAGLRLVKAEVVVVLAADLPFITDDDVDSLVSALTGPDRPANVDGALLVDDHGRDQLLAGAWRTQALRAAAGALGTIEGASMRSLLAPLTSVRVAIERQPVPWWDCDTEEDLAKARTHP